MSCPTPDRVLDYVANRLDSHERDAIDAHVDGCTACRALLVDLVRTRADEIIELAPAGDPLTIGRYEIRARLGDGGMGTVYAAYDPQLDRQVAIKLVHPELAARGGLDRLVREGRALAKLSHPNVVAVHDAGTDGDRVYVAMELVDGTTLTAWLRVRPRRTREILEVFVAAARGLGAAHRVGIVHRDVKPENVLVDREGRVKVADFGLADDQAASSRMTRPGLVLGTPLFMSPEQREGGEVGPASDQYSLCVALESALGGRRVPAWVQRAIARGKAVAPQDRFATIDALGAALDPARRMRRVGAIAAVVVVALGATTAFALRGGPDRVDAACDLATTAPTWAPPDRAAVRAAVLAAGPSAQTTWPKLEAAIDVFATELATAGGTLCEHRPNTTAARETFDLATACLAQRREELTALTVQLRAITAADLPHLVERVHDLDPVEDCENPPLLAAEAAARTTPDGVMRRRSISSAWRGATAAFSGARYTEAATLARQGVTLARAFGGVILVKALLLYSQVASQTEGFVASEMAVREAATIAEAVHADGLRAYALANLAASLAREEGREKEALVLQPIAEAAITSSGKQASLLPVLQQAVGVAELRLGHGEKAVASLTAALEGARKVVPPDDPRLPEYIYPVGVALGMLRRDAEAARYHAEAYRVASAIYGADHPSAVRFEINLAFTHGALGDCTAALSDATHARRALTGVLPASSAEHVMLDEIIGTCHAFQHDTEGALRELATRQAALREGGQAHTVAMAGSLVDLGDVERDRKRYAEARTAYLSALAMYESIVGPADARLALPLTHLGEVELALKHTAAAVTALERALALYEAAGTAALSLADAQFPLARAVWPAPRAIDLATAARDALRAAGPQFASRADEVVAWLASHPRR